MKFEKYVVIEKENFRIIRSDELNYSLEVLTELKNSDNDYTYSFKHKGYFGTIENCLKSLIKNDYLIDAKKIKEIEDYLIQLNEIKKELSLLKWGEVK